MTTPTRVQDLTKIAQGAEAEIFAWEDGKVLRLPFYEHAHDVVERETAAIAAAADGGIRVTSHFGSVTIERRAGQVLERLDGPDLLAALERRPWTMRRQSFALGRLHAALHGIKAPDGMRPLVTVFRDAVAGPVLDTQRPFVERARRVFERLTDGDVLTHGDFHPGNVMLHDGEMVLIDWPNAAAGPPEADVARTLVLLDVAELPPGAPWAARFLAAAGRRLLRRWYFEGYRKARPLDEQALEDWYTAQLLGRLGDKMTDSETKRITALLEKRLG